MRIALLAVLLLAAGLLTWVLTRPSPHARLTELLWRGAEAVNRKEYDRARTLLAGYLQQDPESPRALFLLGVARCGLGEEEDGLALVMSALDLDRSLAGAQLFLGEYYAGENRYSEALVHLEAAPEAEARVIAAEVLTTLGRLAEASAHYSRAIAAGRRDFPVLFAALGIHRTLLARGGSGALLHRERVEQLRALIEGEARSALAGKPDDPQATWWLAQVLDQDDRIAPENIEAAFLRAIEADPADARRRAGYAEFLVRAGRIATARRILSEGLDHPGSAASYLQMADFLGGLLEHEEAASLLEGAVSRWPEDPALRASLALSLWQSGRRERALATIRQGLGSFPESVRLLEAAGDLALAAGEREQADRHYDRALVVRPRQLPLLRKRVALYIDDLIAAVGQEGELPAHLLRTEGLLRELVDLNRWDRAGLLWQAALAGARGRVPLALDLLRGLLKVHPDEWAARSLEGRLLFESRDYQGAMEEALAVIDAGMGGAEDYGTFARAALASGQPALVVRPVERGLARWPEDVELLRSLGEAQLELKRGRDFLSQLEQHPAAVRTDPAIDRLTAWAEWQAGREKQAEQRFRRLLGEEKIGPGEFARFLFAVGRDDEAKAFLRKAAEGDSGAGEDD